MRMKWNEVTRFSMVIAVILYVGTFFLAFAFGAYFEHARMAMQSVPPPPAQQSGGAAGSRCGGFIRGAATCASGFHCQLNASRPDTGGICVADSASAPTGTSTASSTVPAWAQGMTIVTQSDQGKTIKLSLHERFALRLGNNLKWKLTFAPKDGVNLVPNTISAGGFQGVYEAAKIGTTTLSAEGQPICAAGTACPQFIMEVPVTFVISP